MNSQNYTKSKLPGRVAQSVTCLVTDAKLTADPGVASSIPARSHTFVEIDHEIISTVILLSSAESFMKGCCQLQAKVCARLLVNCLFKLAQEKSVVRWTDRPAVTIAVDLGRKATKQTNKQTKSKWVWSGDTTITNCRQAHSTARKSHTTKQPALCSPSRWLQN